MKNLYQRKVKKRTIIQAAFFLFWAVIIVLRLIQLQIIQHPRLKAEVKEQNRFKDTIFPQRGTIYDCKGNILAQSIPQKSIFYTPSESQPAVVQFQKIKTLKDILSLSSYELDKIKTRIQNKEPFIWIKRKVNPETVERVKLLSIEGIYFLEENKRFYPHGSLAAQLIGRVNIDGKGQSGVELSYNSLLEGEKGIRLILRDARNKQYRFETVKPSHPGKDLFLTIDETIQYIAEKELERTVRNYNANWGTVVISRPSTGEILAMANYPRYNLNNLPSDLTTLLRLDRNKAIHYTFSSGSTFKIITASAALESNKVNFRDVFDCSKGYIRCASNTIWDYKKMGILSFPEVIIHSSNVGAVKVGELIGEKSLYQTIKSFGFGEKTGIDLPAEEKGIFRSLPNWSNVSLDYLSIGYEISVTPLQMLQALNVIANQGIAVTPRVAKKTTPSSVQKLSLPSSFRKKISEETASKLTFILLKAVKEGTGQAAQIKGYPVAGKTGTAQKYNPSLGTYSSSAHIASFMGFIPVSKPTISMIVVIDDPQGVYYGGQVAAPLFRRIALQVLHYLNIAPQNHPSLLLASQKYRSNSE